MYKPIFILCAIASVTLSLPLENSNAPFPETNPEELSDNFQGDIELNEEQWNVLSGRSPVPRTGLINDKYRWSNNIVPYELSDIYSTEHVNAIREALDEMENVLCLKFVPRTDEHEDYISVIGSRSGCSSKVGRLGGRQTLNLAISEPGTRCFKKGVIMHEFIHAIGFYHMQSASERDEYVTIEWGNIIPGKEHNFKSFGEEVISQFGVPYDYGSLMHYGKKAFSVNGENTIVPTLSEAAIGQRYEMSEKDIARIRARYGC